MTYDQWAKENMVEELIRVLLRSAYNAGAESKTTQIIDDIDIARRKAETQ